MPQVITFYTGSQSSDVNFRAWTLALHTALVNSGLTDASASNRINFATVTRSVTLNNDSGFVTYRFNDALQATYPVFIKLGFGSAGGSTVPRLNLSWGTATASSGDLVGETGSVLIWTGGSGMAGTAVQACYAHSSGARTLAVISPDDSTFAAMFAIERLKNVTGSDVGDGFAVIIRTQNNTATTELHTHFPLTGSFREASWKYLLPSQNPSLFNGTQSVSPIYPMAGRIFNPVSCIMMVPTSDVSLFGSWSTQSFNVYNQQINYVLTTGQYTVGTNPTSRTFIRWE